MPLNTKQLEETIIKFLGEIQEDANHGQLGYESVKIGLSKQLVGELGARAVFLENELFHIAGRAGLAASYGDDFHAIGVLLEIRDLAKAANLPAKTIEAA